MGPWHEREFVRPKCRWLIIQPDRTTEESYLLHGLEHAPVLTEPVWAEHFTLILFIFHRNDNVCCGLIGLSGDQDP